MTPTACLIAAALAAVPEPTPVFQPAFHQALRWSYDSGRATYRLIVPLGRGGGRVKVSFRAGDAGLTLYAASVAEAASGGALASPPVPLTFGGGRSYAAAARERFTSDPVPLPLAPGSELAVSFEVEGALAASAIDAFPGGSVRPGSYADSPGALGGSAWQRAVGLDTVDVEGPAQRAFVAIGDSITEGFVSDSGDDYRNAWPAVAQRALLFPVVDAAVYGQDTAECASHLSTEVLPLRGITDCVVLIGTNDLGARSAAEEISLLGALYDQLRGACRVWGATLPPRETSSHPLADVVAQRRQINAWLRQEARLDGLLDFDAALADPSSPDRFLPGFGEDGVHPTVEGQRAMGEEAARKIRPTVLAISSFAPAAGGTQLAVAGAGFLPGSALWFGGVPSPSVVVKSPSELLAVVPAALESGPQRLLVELADGERAAGPEYSSARAPSLASAEPAVASTQGGTRILLRGSDFAAGARVRFDGVEGTGVVLRDASALSVIAPPHAAGAAAVAIQNPDGQVGALSGGISFATPTALLRMRRTACGASPPLSALALAAALIRRLRRRPPRAAP